MKVTAQRALEAVDTVFTLLDWTVLVRTAGRIGGLTRWLTGDQALRVVASARRVRRNKTVHLRLSQWSA